jgi:hypothetical protein
VTAPAPNALHSLYGGAQAREGSALAGNVGGQEREQEVCTPDWIVDVVRRTFGGEIALDPCAPSKPENPLIAVGNYTEADNGLLLPWRDRSYFNPPYADLQAWLEKAAHEARHGFRIVGLFPHRPHRRWFHPPLRGAEVVSLNYNVKFRGHKNAFPAPLDLVGWNCSIPDLGERETDRRVW